MWRRVYFALLLVRTYFAFSPSYIHPDEQFQGPEIIAGQIFDFPSQKTWEWTSSTPVRSVFPLWLFYGVPMALLKWVFGEHGSGAVSARLLYYSLRAVMAILSLVLEDWAIYELIRSPRQRRQAVVLVASSYVTWTFQSHTFSNSLETLLVLWSLVLTERILTVQKPSLISCNIISILFVIGTFNRVTFPAFVLVPTIRLFRYFIRRPITALVTILFCLIFSVFAISTDTVFYQPSAAKSYPALFRTLFRNPTITPLNNLLYNSQASNLALHGLHPRYQHVLVNLPQLLGPSLVLLVWSVVSFSASGSWSKLSSNCLTSTLTGTLFLSLLPHQEPRFLLPTVPLLLASLRLPESRKARRLFWVIWATFNLFMGLLMGSFHQGGVIEIQLGVPNTINSMFQRHDVSARQMARLDGPRLRNTTTAATIYWWKTYPPPSYLLGKGAHNPYSDIPINVSTIALMGRPFPNLYSTLSSSVEACFVEKSKPERISQELHDSPAVFVALPFSSLPSKYSPEYVRSSWVRTDANDWSLGKKNNKLESEIRASLVARYPQHVNLDDIDFEKYGIRGTIERVVGQMGLGLWYLERACFPDGGSDKVE